MNRLGPTQPARAARLGWPVGVDRTEAAQYSSDEVLAQEEHIVTWAMAAQATEPAPSTTVERGGLDVAQHHAAASVAGHDGVVLVVGPAGTGKTRMLAAAATDLGRHGRAVFGLAPTAKAARVLERDTGTPADTVAKLLHEWRRSDRPPEAPYQLPAGATVLVDEASMISTPDLYELVRLTETQRWRLVLVGDHRQLQAVGRGGLFAELCMNGRVEELEQLHRFAHRWEAAASLQLRSGDPRALDAYELHDRIAAGTIDNHIARMAEAWVDHDRRSDNVALVASTNDHVDAINRHVQAVRLARCDIDPHWQTPIAGGEVAHGGDVVVTRRNDRHLHTSAGQPVRNRETWTVDEAHRDGSLTVTQRSGHGSVVLPTDYVRQHVRLGYAATEHGYQSETADTSICLASPITTRRGLYVAATRGRDRNDLRVITDTTDVAEARNVLDRVLASDRADIPAVTQRRTLAAQDRRPTPPAPPQRTPRCEIPEWFEPLLAKARADLAGMQRRDHDSKAARAGMAAQLAEAEQTLQRIDAETDPDRYLLALMKEHADLARQAHAIAVHEFAEASWRQRRIAREVLAVAERRSAAADRELQHITTVTAASVERYRQAVEHMHQAKIQLDSFGRGQRTVTRWRDVDMDAAARRVEALETWHQWASGAEIATSRLRPVGTALTSLPWGVHTAQERALGRMLDQWLTSFSPSLPRTITRPPTAPTLGLGL